MNISPRAIDSLEAQLARKAKDVDISVADDSLEESVLYIGISGDIKVDLADGGTVTFSNYPVGFLPAVVTKVYKIGTTADDIIALS